MTVLKRNIKTLDNILEGLTWVFRLVELKKLKIKYIKYNIKYKRLIILFTLSLLGI